MVHVEQVVMVLKTVQLQLLPHLLDPILAQHLRTRTALPVLNFAFHLCLLSLGHFGSYPRILRSKFLEKSHG